MNREGYWLNAVTGTHHRIDEHARWLTRPGNAEAIGLDPSLARRLDGLHWDRDRLRILLTGMRGGLVRVRSHGDRVSFEFTLDFADVLPAIPPFLGATDIAGPLSTLRITNLRARRTLQGALRELRGGALSSDPAVDDLPLQPVELTYSAEEVDRILAELPSPDAPDEH